MFTKSATPATPVVRPKSHITESVTWVREWTLLDSSNSSSVPKLMAWVKREGVPPGDAPSISTDSIVLDDFKYYEEPVIEEAPAEDKLSDPVNTDLKLALSMDKKDDQISSLSGLGM